MAAFDGTFLAPWGANTAKEYAQAVAAPVASAPTQFGQTLGNMYGAYNQGYGSYNQGLASLGNSYAQNYAAMAGGIGQLANSIGNTWNNTQANNQASSAAEAARQAAVSNLGTAAMANYGNVAGQGLQAWAQNQNGYQRALSDMNVGNQNALSQLGAGRYNALAGLGKADAAMSVGRDVAGALPSLAGAVNGGSMGGYGGGGGGFGSGLLGGLRGDINNGAEMSSLNQNYLTGLNSLNEDQALARNMPRTMVGDAYGALMDFNKLNLGASASGMNQFYDFARDTQANTNRPGQEIPTGSLLDALSGGYTSSANRIGSVQKDMNSGWSDNKNIYNSSTAGVNDLFDRSIGNMGVFRNPAQIQQEEFALQDAALRRRKQEQERSRADVVNSPYSGLSQFLAGNPNERRPIPKVDYSWRLSPTTRGR